MIKRNKTITRLGGIILSVVMALGMRNIDVWAQENETEIMIENDIPEDLIGYFESKDYEVTSVTDENGNEEWYLLNNLEGTRIRISEIDMVVSDLEQKEAEIDDLKSTIKTLKTVGIIILLIMTGALVWALIMWKREWNINNSWRKTSEKSSEKSAKKPAKCVDVDNYSNSGAIKFGE